MIDLNYVSLAGLSGAVAGSILGGLGARLAMRFVALVIGATPTFTVEGTLALMVGGALVGIPIGLAAAGIYTVTRRRWPVLGLGIALGVLVGLVFMLSPGGEFGLLPPWQGALLFGPLPLAVTCGALILYTYLRRKVRGERRTPVWWLAAYVAAAVWAVAGLGTLAGETPRLPRVAWALADWFGPSVSAADLASTVAIYQAAGLLFLAGYCGLTWLVFCLAPARTVQAGAIGCLLLAAGLFHSRGPLGGALRSGNLMAGVLPGLAAVLGIALLVVVYWRLLSQPSPGISRSRLMASLVLVCGGLVVIWGVVALAPGYGLTNVPAWTTVFAVTLYLLPWLGLPAGLLWTVLPAERTPRGQPVLLAETAVRPAPDAR